MSKATKLWAFAGGAVILGVALAITLFLVPLLPRNYRMSSAVMEPSLSTGSMVWVRHRAYKSVTGARRGDVIIFSRADETSGKPVDYVTRVIGLPGDRIVMLGTTLEINGRAVPHALESRSGKVAIYRETQGAATYRVQYGDGPEPGMPYASVVPPDALFCLGDNRDNSYDSRFIGAVPFADVRGKQVF